MEKELNTLKQLGFTEYESKAYIALINLISAKADEISKYSNVPRSKIYSTLEILHTKGLIEIHSGRPITYSVINPKDTLPIYREQFNENFDLLENKLINMYENKIPKINTPIQSIESPEKIYEQKFSLIRNACEKLYLRIGFIIPSEINSFKKQIKYISKKGIQINILATKSFTFNNKKINLEKELEELNVNIKYMNLPSAQLFIRDDKEMFLIFAESSENNINDKNMIGLYNTYPTIISNYKKAFERQFD